MLRRPLLIHASNRDIEMFGRGYWGVAGLHMPIRLPIEEVSTLLTRCIRGSSLIHLSAVLYHLAETRHSSICTSVVYLSNTADNKQILSVSIS